MDGEDRTESTAGCFHELAREACAGSQPALEELVRTYEPAIRRAVRRKLNWPLRSKFDSADFVQMVWQALCTNPDALAHCRTPDELLACLIRMAVNGVNQAGREYVVAKKRDLRCEDSVDSPAVVETLISHEPAPGEAAAMREEFEGLLKGQSERVQQVLRLRCDGSSSAQIAAELKINERSVRKILKRNDPRRPR